MRAVRQSPMGSQPNRMFMYRASANALICRNERAFSKGEASVIRGSAFTAD